MCGWCPKCENGTILSPNYSKFVVEYERNSKISQNVRKGFRKIFRKKTWFFFKIIKGGKFAVQSVSDDIFSLKRLFHFYCQVFFEKKIDKF